MLLSGCVTGRVKLNLASMHLSHLKRVNVDVYDGTVYLTGAVDSVIEKADAEIAAWKSKGVEQVVNDLVVRGADNGAPAASALPDFRPRHALMERFSSIARVERGKEGGPELAYDTDGRLVASIHTVSSRVLLNRGLATLPSAGRPIDHVSIYPIAVAEDVPEPEYAIVLWHVSESPATPR